MADISFGRVPFAEQIAFFRAKKNVLTESYLDVWAEQHDHAFMVAGANRDALLADLRTAIDKVATQGATIEDFRRDFDAIVEQYGWKYNGGRNWRSRVIYETNLRTSYAAGRWQQLQQLKQDMPYWQYVHKDGERYPRPMHLAWNGLVLRADDPWWLTHFGPNGWGCQCTARALDARDLKKLGKDGPDKAPPIDMQQVTIGQRSPGGPREVETPAGVDPGFGYAPGRSVDPDTAAGFGQLRAPPGVPPIRGKITGGIDAPFDATDARYTGLPEATAQTLFEVERQIVRGSVEYARAIDDVGNIVVEETGSRDLVDLSRELKKLPGTTLTHNHVADVGFSWDDIGTAAYGDVREVRVVSPQRLYRLGPSVGAAWPGELATAAFASNAVRGDIMREQAPYRRQLQRLRPRLAPEIIDMLCLDRIALLLARRYPLLYQVVTSR